uniref:COMPASS complex protein n=1 Tax=Mycena chlorophos TaxID=658473 RepID=A0ABQ0KZ32_MYCCL|nr:COMPASS complex protein [Mycena chlorophos]
MEASPQPPPAAPVPLSNSRKRKRPPATSASPAPQDPATPVPEVLSRLDLSSRPQLSISRGPFFIPTTDASEFFKTDLTGLNRIGFRYSPAGINPPGHVLPCRTIESNPTEFRVSWEDRSSFVHVTKDGLTLLGGKGFRSARCNAPIREGRWYMEVKVIRGGGEHVLEDGKREGSHVRVGWARREAPLNGPVGLDGYSYGYRDKTGDKVTLSRPKHYGRPYTTGDVIGMYICLPPRREADPNDPHDPARLKRERIAIDLKGQEVFETLEYTQSKEMTTLMDYSGKSSTSASIPSASKKSASGKLPERGPPNAPKKNANLRPLPILPDSHIAFFLNGECQGLAFQDLYDYLQLRQTAASRKVKERSKRGREGVKEHSPNPFDDGTLGYYPFISLFNEASVRLNPGPHFDFPPPPNIDKLLFPDLLESEEQHWRPCSDRYAEFMKEQWELDALEEEDAKSDLVRVAAAEKVLAEKKAQRDKKRQQAEARKKAKLAVDTPAPDDPRPPTPTLSGPGQPSPLRHGIAYENAEMEEDSKEGLTTYNPSPLRQNALSAADYEDADDSASVKSREASPTRQSAFVPFKREDFRYEPGALAGPGQPGDGWIPHQRLVPKDGAPSRSNLVGPGSSGLAALLNASDAEMSPFTKAGSPY